MTPDKGRRLATAVGFLAGIYGCLHVLRDAKILWPPEALWSALAHPQRLELGGGIALIVVTLVLTFRRASSEKLGGRC